MLLVSLKGLWSSKRRFLGTLLAIVLGVAFLSGTLLLGDTLRTNFDRLFQQADGATDVVVRSTTRVGDGFGPSARAGVDGSLVTPLQRVPGIAVAVPYIEGNGQLLGRDGKRLGGNGPPTRAANWVTDPSLNPYRLVEGRAPRVPDEAVINRGAATAGNLHIGDTATLLTPAPVPIRIVGIATFGTADGFGPSTFTGLTLAAAEQHLTGGSGQVTEIRIAADPGVTPDELAASVRPVLPPETEAITGTQLANEDFEQVDTGFLAIVRKALLAFAVIALVVAALSVSNTFAILAAQRSRSTALLRSLGATRRQVIGAGLIETVAVGIVGSVLGWVAGVAIAGLLKAAFDGFGFALPAGGLVIVPSSVVLALGAGLAATVLAGVVPTVRASRVAPVEALRASATEPASVGRARTFGGLAVLMLGAAMVVLGVSLSRIGVAALGALATIVGVVLSGPLASRPAAAVLGRPVAALRRITGTLARENARRHPRRTAATASALMIGVTVVAVFTVIAASLKASVSQQIDDVLTADVVVDTPGYGGRTGAQGFSPQLASEISMLPGVKAAVGVEVGPLVIDGTSHTVSVADPATVGDVLNLGAGDTLGRLGPNSIAVSSAAARSHHWMSGDVVAVTFPDGSDGHLTVAGTYARTGVVGDYVLAPTAWMPHESQPGDSEVFVKLDHGVSLDAALQRISTVARPFGGPRVQDRADYRTSATAGINTILGLVYVMLALAILIALMGIANTLSLSIHERSREIGLLRAVGQTQHQTRSMIRWESVIIAVFGALGGIVLGAFLGWGLVIASTSTGLGVFALPVGQLVAFLVVGAAAGVLASLRPARRAARLDVLAAIGSE
jgi:putative ABC transport system permease protein